MLHAKHKVTLQVLCLYITISEFLFYGISVCKFVCICFIVSLLFQWLKTSCLFAYLSCPIYIFYLIFFFLFFKCYFISESIAYQ